MKPIIAVDIDDVLADSTEALRREVNRQYGVDLQPADYQVAGEYWGYYSRVWSAHGLANQVNLQTLDRPMAIDQSHVPPMAGAVQTINQLAERYQIIAVTAREMSWQPPTIICINQYFGDCISKIVFCGRSEAGDDRSKGVVCAELGAGWLIDDNLSHAQSAIEQGIQVVLFGTYGWHDAAHPAMKSLIPLTNWQQILDYFNDQ